MRGNALKKYKEILQDTIYPEYIELACMSNSLDESLIDLHNYIKEIKKYKVFYDHINKHLEGTDKVVICKICNKTYQEIIIEEMLCRVETEK